MTKAEYSQLFWSNNNLDYHGIIYLDPMIKREAIIEYHAKSHVRKKLSNARFI